MYSNNNLFETIFNRVKAQDKGCTVFVPHVCNNIDSFGAGFAAQIANYFPSVKADYHLLGKNFLKANLGYAQILTVYEEPKYKHKIHVVNMIAQNGTKSLSNPRPLNYCALMKSMAKVNMYISMNTGFTKHTENIEIHAPKFGSGLAGGNWSFISDIIDDMWGKYSVTVYNYNPKAHDQNKK
jgi:O-acetyl-ADP-ribose deacetylase (regulator of RNase III)